MERRRWISPANCRRAVLRLVPACLLAAAIAAPSAAQVTLDDAISREYTVEVVIEVAPDDAVSREFTVQIFESATVSDAVSRDLTVMMLDPAAPADAISREFTFYIEDPANTADAVSRELTLYFLADVAPAENYIAHEIAAIPQNTVRIMTLAAPPAPGAYTADLYVTAAGGLGGSETDPGDDVVYRMFRSLDLEPMLTFPDARTDPIAAAFGPAGGSGADLILATRGLDGADSTGALITLDPSWDFSPFADLEQEYPDLWRITARPAASAGYEEGIYVATGTGGPHQLVVVTPAGGLGAYALDHGSGLRCAAFAPADRGGMLHVGGDDRVIYRADPSGALTPLTADLGASVQSLEFGRGPFPFDEDLYALLADGRIVRVDSTGTATEFFSGLMTTTPGGQAVVNDLGFTTYGDELYVTDAGRRLIYAIRYDPPTPVEEIAQEIPRATALDGVYPNPFNPTTTVQFSLHRPGPVDLTLYDVRGREVRRLARGEYFPAGVHRVVWDGRDDAGRGAASGSYLLVMQAGRQRFRTKLMLLK